MMSKKEVLAFLAKYDDDDAVFGINEDGITISELKHPNDYLEVGGLPESYVLSDQPTVCPHCGARTSYECLTPTVELHECMHCTTKFYFHHE